MKDFKKVFVLLLCSVFITSIVLINLVSFNRMGGFSSLKILNEQTPSCGRLPAETDIFIDNTVWQVLQLPKGFVKILNAYLDTRPNQGVNKTVVRLNVNSVMLNKSDIFFCQFWYDGKSEPTVVNATDVLLQWG
jgi:hypothetical protein